MKVLWEQLPDADDPKDSIESYYRNKPLDFLVVCLRSVLVELERANDSKDDSASAIVRKKEVPLIGAIAQKATRDQTSIYAGLLNRFSEICLDANVANATMQLLGKRNVVA